MGRLSAVLLLSVNLALTGCTTMHAIPTYGQFGAPPDIDAGDFVTVTLRNGEVQQLTVVDVTPEALTGYAGRPRKRGVQQRGPSLEIVQPSEAVPVRIALSDISMLEVRGVDTNKTVAAIFSGTLIVVGGLYALLRHWAEKSSD